ncbi:uncharacterized protein LOC127843711 [Dreissena polymorpha]|uniref:NACHT domain-containing protein n=1 Tax=Dreissena polymorpha TaxID=45954 RepID=A0A9D4E1B8_DREPO|nr:uncharacterized protein LOC127843711 [Dreissena polymorpha]KAH3770666.1 hypothetical protein DPMN_171958 [Dreissena polymorpha]
MENIDLKELFNDADTCHFMDTSSLIPLCLCALLGIVTYLAHNFFQKRFKKQNFVNVHNTIVMETHTSFLGGDMKASETDLTAFVEKSAIDTGRKIEYAAMNITENQQECAVEILSQTALLRTEMLSQTESLNNKIDHLIAEQAPRQDEYVTQRQELIELIKKLYTFLFNYLTISPLNDNINEQLQDVYMQPKMWTMCKDKGAFKKTDKPVRLYKDVCFTDTKVNQRIFLQGEAGSGKTTFFLAKMAMDWCGGSHVSSASGNSSLFFRDVDFLQGYTFLFHITLRHSVQLVDVYTMIKKTNNRLNLLPRRRP